MCDLIRLADVLAWPSIALIGIAVLARAPARELMSGVVRRVSRFRAAGVVDVELTPEASREVKGELRHIFRAFRDSATTAFDAQVYVEQIQVRLEQVAQMEIKPALVDPTDSFRTTVYVPDILFEDVLYRLVGYYPAGGGRGSTYSARFGIIGKAWRLQRSECASVPAETEKLIGEWGMTIAEASRRQRSKTYVCIILRDDDKQAIGLLFVDSEAVDAFATDVVQRLETSQAVHSLAQAVDRVTRHVREAGQSPVKIFDE
jgi:hypothetical protein